MDIKKLLVEMKNEAEKCNAGKMVVKFEKSGLIDGWDFAIVVQCPDFKPCRGEWKI